MWRLGDRPTILVQKRPCRPGHRPEASLAVVEVQHVHLTVFQNPAFGSVFQPIAIFGQDHLATVHIHHRESRGANRRRAIIGHVEVQIAVVVDVRQGQGRCAELARQAALSRFAEPSIAFIQEKPGPHADAIDQQVQVTVAIDIREHRAG